MRVSSENGQTGGVVIVVTAGILLFVGFIAALMFVPLVSVTGKPQVLGGASR